MSTSILFDMFTGVMFIFSSARFLIMCKPKTGWSTSIGILRKSGDSECRLTWFDLIRNFLLQIKFIIFQGCPIKQVVYLPGHPTPYNQLLIQPLLLVPECCFAENFEARVSFSSFGYQFELIFASYSVPWVFNIYIIWHLEIKM